LRVTDYSQVAALFTASAVFSYFWINYPNATAIAFTRYSKATFIHHLYIPRENEALISSLVVLPSSCSMFYDILYAQISLQPLSVKHRQQTLSVALYAQSNSLIHTMNVLCMEMAGLVPKAI
jgi:hypothetical protein